MSEHKWPTGLVPCDKPDCARAQVVSMDGMRKLKPKANGSPCPKCGVLTVTKDDLKGKK